MSPTSFDLEEEPTVIEPEIVQESELPTLHQPEQFTTTLQGYRDFAKLLTPHDDISVKRCAAFIQTCKMAEKFADSERKKIVDPLNKQVKAINETWMPIASGFNAVWREVDGRLSRYIHEQQQLALEAQRKENERAEKEKAELARKAAAARGAAEKAAQSGDEKAAAKAEGQADRLALKADMVVANVVPVQPRTLDLGGATLTAKAPKKVWVLPGWDKATKLYGDDARLKGVDPAWLLRFCVLDVVRLNAAYKSGEKFPEPFEEAQEFGGSTLRGGK